MATYNPIAFNRGEAVTLPWTMAPTTDITGWTIRFTVRATPSSGILVQVTPATLTNASAGTFAVSLTSAQTQTLPSTAVYDVWRTDSGAESELSYGPLTVATSVSFP